MERLPMTHESRLLAALLLAPLLLWAEFTHAHDIAAVKSAIEGTRQAVRSVDMRYSVKVTMFRGSLTAAARFDFPALEGDVPASEELLSYENQLLIDFATGRFAMDGSTDHFKVRLDEVGKVIVDSYTIYSRSAFDGSRVYMLRPKDKLDPRSVPPGIKYPVEFLEFDSKDGGEVSDELLPLYLWSGALPLSDVPLQPTTSRAALDFKRCRAVTVPTSDGRGAVVLTTWPTSSGAYSEFVLNAIYSFRPTKWIRYSPNGARIVADIRYRVLQAEGVPIVESWTTQQYSSTGALQRQVDVSVLSFKPNPQFDDGRFRLQPTSGMVVQEGISSGTSFKRAGDSVSFQTNYELNHYMEETEWSWSAVAGIIAIIVCLILVTAILVRNICQRVFRERQRPSIMA
jgi:hypothetical protein